MANITGMKGNLNDTERRGVCVWGGALMPKTHGGWGRGDRRLELKQEQRRGVTCRMKHGGWGGGQGGMEITREEGELVKAT